METISIHQALEKIKATRATGEIFGVTFIKRTDGTLREMSARFGVTKGVKGVGLAFDPKAKDLMVVYDMNNNFRMVNIPGIREVQVQGIRYSVTHLP